VTDTAAPVAAELHDGLVDGLSAGGVLTASWCAAFRAVPRHLFVPDLVWRSRAGGHGLEPVRRADRPDTWWDTVYRDEFVVTQINDGRFVAGARVMERQWQTPVRQVRQSIIGIATVLAVSLSASTPASATLIALTKTSSDTSAPSCTSCSRE